MTKFWRTWLHIWCVSAGLLGLILAGAAFDSTSLPSHIYFQLIGSPDGYGPTSEMRFTLALLGAVTIGWSLTLWTTMQAAFKLNDEEATTIWKLLTLSLLTWFVIDSALSIHTGFGRNALVNTLFLIGFLLPMIKSGSLQGNKGAIASHSGAPS